MLSWRWKELPHAARQTCKRLSGCNVRQRWQRLQVTPVSQKCLCFCQRCVRSTSDDISLLSAFKIPPPQTRSCEVRHNVTCLQWTSSPKLRSSRPRGSAEAPPPHERGPPSSSSGRPVSSRASRQRRECRGELWVALCSLHSLRHWFQTLARGEGGQFWPIRSFYLACKSIHNHC